MKKHLIMSLGLLVVISASASANCPDLAKKAVSATKLEKAVSAQTYRSFYTAVKHYRDFSEAGSSSEARIEETSVYKKNGRITGYEVILSDGGDESTVRYVFDQKRRPIVAYWYNQSPMTFWFCTQNDTISEEETADGSEI